jgi:hypothetical protein
MISRAFILVLKNKIRFQAKNFRALSAWYRLKEQNPTLQNFLIFRRLQLGRFGSGFRRNNTAIPCWTKYGRFTGLVPLHFEYEFQVLLGLSLGKDANRIMLTAKIQQPVLRIHYRTDSNGSGSVTVLQY